MEKRVFFLVNGNLSLPTRENFFKKERIFCFGSKIKSSHPACEARWALNVVKLKQSQDFQRVIRRHGKNEIFRREPIRDLTSSFVFSLVWQANDNGKSFLLCYL